MGWVTLALRKASLKQEHAAYQLRLLQVSREKRQMARKKTYDTNCIMNEQKQALRGLKESVYEVAKQTKKDQLEALQNAWKLYQAEQSLTGDDATALNRLNHVSTYLTDPNGQDPNNKPSDTEIKTYNELISKGGDIYNKNTTGRLSYSDWESSGHNPLHKSKNEIISEFEDASIQYQDQVNDIKSEYEFDLQMVEEEAADEEVILDQEQTEIEAQMEAISQEMNAVGEAVSSQIQASTIKLA